MPISDITDKIISNASRNRENTLKGADAEIQKIKEVSEKKLKEEMAAYENETQNILKKNKQKVILDAEKKGKKIIEKTKHYIYNKVFDQSLQRLRSLDDEKYKKILVSFFKALPKNTGGIIYSPPKRLKITEETAREFGVSCAIKEDASIKGGFVLKEEKFEYDLTFEKLVNDAKRNLEIDVVKIIFS